MPFCRYFFCYASSALFIFLLKVPFRFARRHGALRHAYSAVIIFSFLRAARRAD